MTIQTKKAPTEVEALAVPNRPHHQEITRRDDSHDTPVGIDALLTHARAYSAMIAAALGGAA